MDWLVLILLVLYAAAFIAQLAYLSRYQAQRDVLVAERERDLDEARELSHTLHQATHTPVRPRVRAPYQDVYARYAAALDETREANERLDQVMATSGAAAPDSKGSPFALLLLLPLTLPIVRWKREGERLKLCLESEAQPVQVVGDILNEIAALGQQEKAQVTVVSELIEQARRRIRNECKAERLLEPEKADLVRIDQGYQEYARLIEIETPPEENVEDAFGRRAQILASLQTLEKRIAANEQLREDAWAGYGALDRSIVWLEEQIQAEAASRPSHYLAKPTAQFRRSWRDYLPLLEKGQYEQARQQITSLKQEVSQAEEAHRELRKKQQWIKERVSALHKKLDGFQEWVENTPKEFLLDASGPLLENAQAVLVSLYQLAELDDPGKVREADEIEVRLRSATAQLDENRMEFQARAKQYLSRRDGLTDDAIAELARRADKCKEELERCHADYCRSFHPVTLSNLARDLKKEHGELRPRLRPVQESKFDLVLIQIDDWWVKRNDLIKLCADSDEIVHRVERDREEARTLLKDKELLDLLRRCRVLPRDWDKNQVVIKGFDERYRQCSTQTETERENYSQLVRAIRQLYDEMGYVVGAYDEDLRRLQELITAERTEPARLIDSLSSLDGQMALGLAERARRKQVELRAKLVAVPATFTTLHEGNALRGRIQALTRHVQPEVNALLQENMDLHKAQQVTGGSLTDAAQALARYIAIVEESPWRDIAEVSNELRKTQTRLVRLDARRESIERRLSHSTLQRALTELHEIAAEASEFCAEVGNQHNELTRTLAALDDMANKLTRASAGAARVGQKDPTRVEAWDRTDAEVKRCWNQARRAATLRVARAEIAKAQGLVDDFRRGT